MPFSKVLLGKRIKELRLQNGLTLEHLAELIDVSPAHLGKVERGKRILNIEKTSLLCDVLDVPMGDLFAQTNAPRNPAYASPYSSTVLKYFEEIIKGCSPETIDMLLDVDRRIVQSINTSTDHKNQ